jgi:hypothetical protein
MSEPKPVVIKLNPSPEEYLKAETAFLRAVGACVTSWAFVDRQLFGLFRTGLHAPTDAAAMIYYGQNTIGRNLGQVDVLLSAYLAHLKDEKLKADWKQLLRRTSDLLPVRNAIVHQPSNGPANIPEARQSTSTRFIQSRTVSIRKGRSRPLETSKNCSPRIWKGTRAKLKLWKRTRSCSDYRFGPQKTALRTRSAISRPLVGPMTTSSSSSNSSLRMLHGLQAATMFSQHVTPPRDRGIT